MTQSQINDLDKHNNHDYLDIINKNSSKSVDLSASNEGLSSNYYEQKYKNDMRMFQVNRVAWVSFFIMFCIQTGATSTTFTNNWDFSGGEDWAPVNATTNGEENRQKTGGNRWTIGAFKSVSTENKRFREVYKRKL